MEWKPEYSVGISLIDRQHQEILRYINQLTSALGSKDCWSITHHMLTQLDDYMRVHFAVEEALLEITHYPELAAHAASHAEIRKHMRALEARSLKEDISEDLIQFLRAWFIEHVLKSDRNYGHYMIRQFPKMGDEPQTVAGV